MTQTTFDRDAMAKWYAKQHLSTDPSIRTVYYLPAGAGEREIRLVEVNESIVERPTASLEPLDFGVDIGKPDGHTLVVIDITPGQWEQLQSGKLELPPDWVLHGAAAFRRTSR